MRRILHVSLGSPAYRSGGLNRYVKDLTAAQTLRGDIPSVLYPGICAGKVKILSRGGAGNLYAIHGALPVPLSYGIDNPERYMMKSDTQTYINFLKHIAPDIVHIHSFMGIHREFFTSCQTLGIPSILTTHDYFPLCFRCVLLDKSGDICSSGYDPERCSECNSGSGLSPKTQMFMQSEIYHWLKNSRLFKLLKAPVIRKAGNRKAASYPPESFASLHEYYSGILGTVSLIHCNSTLTRSIYSQAYSDMTYETIPICHAGILSGHHRRKGPTLRMSYFGGTLLRRYPILQGLCSGQESDKAVV